MGQDIICVKYSQEQNPILNHLHDSHQLIYVVKGSARITVSGNVYSAKAGTLVLISRLESHAIQIESADYSRYTVQISPDISGYSTLLGDKLLSLLVNRPARFRHAVDMSGCLQLERILRQMALEGESDAPMGDKLQMFLLCQLLVLCYRRYPEQIPENTRNLELIQRVQRHIEENVTAKCSLEELAKQFHLSKSYLSHLFKQITGCSIIGYLTAYRIVMAKHYLAETDWGIGKIVEACGFSDNSNFSRTFKTATGLSPTAFRMQYRKQ